MPKSEDTKADDKAAPAAAEPTAAEVVEQPEAVEEVPQAPIHTAFLDHADKGASANHMGVDIVRGENGFYLVPLTFVEALIPHGFTVVSEGK